MKKINLVLFSLYFFVSFAHANDYEVTFYTRHHGLPQDYIYSLSQDKKSYLWIGTGSGLARFDGKNFELFKTTNGLKENFITSSVVLPNGSRLFSHFNGSISSYFNGKFSLFTNKPITNASINKIFYDKNGNLWSGTKDGELIVIDNAKNQTRKWLLGEYESVNFIDSIGGTQNLLVSSDIHLYLVSQTESSGKPYSFRTGIPDSSGVKNISRLNGHTWIVFSQDRSIYLVRELNKELIFEEISLPNKAELKSTFVQSLANNKCWVANGNGTWKEYKYSNGGFELISTVKDKNLTSQAVPNQLFEDNEGNIWIGTYGSGLFKFSLKRSTFFSLDRGKDLKVNTIELLSNQELLVGTSSGLFITLEDRSNFKKINNLFENEGVVSVCQFENDEYLVATENSRIYNWNKVTNKLKEWNLPVSEQDKIKQIIKDNEGNIWVATSSGAILYDKDRKNFKILTMEDGLAHNYVYNIYPDSKGRVWFGTHKSGLSFYEKKKIVTIKSPLENSGLDVNCFIEDKNGHIWIGTSGQGIFILDENDVFVNYISSSDGLVSDYIYFFQKDLSGAIWVGHKNGLGRILPTYTNGVVISDYTQYLAENELTQATYSVINTNDIWLAGNNMCIRLNINPENKTPVGSYVDISDLKLNYEKINWGEYKKLVYHDEIPDDLEFSHNENLLTFSFNGISFSYNDKLRYQYMLDGFDDKWSLLTEQNFVTYNKLPPGKYTFLVKSRNYAGIWSTEATALHFTITPPYWETWWFRIVSVVVVISVVYVFVKVRTANLRKRNEALEIEKAKLEREINERKKIENKLLRSELSLRNTNQELNTLIYRASHDLRGPVSTISGLVNVANLRILDKESLSFFGMINTSVEKLDAILKKLFLVSEMKQNEIHPEVFNLKDSIFVVLNTFAEVISEKGFDVEVKDQVGRSFCTDKNMFETIVKNLADNAFMYNRKTGCRIVISMEVIQGDLVMKFWDNGKGIKEDLLDKVFDMFYKASDLSKGNGLGLYIVRNAIQLLKGDVFIKSIENEYTLVEVHIPEYQIT